MRFCAICTREIVGLAYRAPLGRNDAMVSLCKACEREPATEKRGPDLPYEWDESVRDFRKKLRDASKRISGDGETRRMDMVHTLSPGYLIVRIPLKDALGNARDKHEAGRVFAGEPWAGSVRYLGVDSRFHLWERPEPIKPELKDPLAEVEAYRSKP